MIALLLLLLVPEGWAGEEEGAAASAEVEAGFMELRGPVIHGGGGVVARLGPDRLEAERFSLDRESGRLELWEGTWTRDGRVVRFARAELALDGSEGLADEVQVDAGRLRLSAGALRWTEEGDLDARSVRLSTCDCEAPPWEVQAREVSVDERAAAWRGGVLRLCGLPVLPVPPGRLSLADRSSGLLPPEVGFDRDGLRIGLPVYLVAGEGADLTLTPELRTGRGARLRSEGRWAVPGGTGQARLDGGWDTVEDQARGAGSLRSGFADGPWRLAAEGSVVSDREYIADMGESYESRGLPWAESRLVVGRGGLRAEHDSFQALGEAEDQLQHLLGLVARSPLVTPLPGLSLDGGARVDLVGQGPSAWSLDAAPHTRGQIDLHLAGGVAPGPLRVEPRAELVVRSWDLAASSARAEARLDTWLPTWARLGQGRLVGEWGLRATAAAGQGEPGSPFEEEALIAGDGLVEPPWSIGPAAQGRLVLPASVPLFAGGELRMAGDGLRPRLWAQAALERWQLSVLSERELTDLGLRFDDQGLLAAFGLVAAEGLVQSRSELRLRHRSVEAGYRTLVDVAAGSMLSHGPSLGWRSACDCLELASRLTWSADRTWPAASIQVEVR